MTGFDDIIIKTEEVKEEDGGTFDKEEDSGCGCGCEIPDEKNDGGEILNKPSCKSVHVAFVMDHSGSMTSQRKLALDNYNEQLASLKRKTKTTGIETYVTLVEFDNRILVPYKNKLVSDIEPNEDYWTEGLTSLNDAIFKGTTLLKKSMNNDTCDDISALMIIMTDGHENSSVEFAGIEGRDSIRKEIEKLEKTGEWTFTFMGANIDVQATAVAGFGMSAGNTMSFTADDQGFKMSNGSVQGGLNKYYDARTYGAKNVADFHVDNSTTGDKPDTVATSTVKDQVNE